jgi:lysophospholipase L1-like esterase
VLVLSCLAHARTSVLLIGDSITQGSIGNATSDPQDGLSYAELLTASLGPEYEVVNTGCGGSRSRDWLPSAGPTTCDFVHPAPVHLFADRVFPADVATVMLGTNDANYGFVPPESADVYRRNMTDLVDHLLSMGVGNVILMTAPPRPEVARSSVLQDGNPAVSAALRRYRDVLLEVCGSHAKVYCIDVHALLSADMDRFFYDRNLHPNDAAHALIHEALRAQILALP